MRNQMVRWDGDDLYWSELRPDEAGRIVVCHRDADGAISDVTPQGFNARSRVHEYGGGHYAVRHGTVFFTNFKDQRLYRQERGGAPRAITPEADIRHADMLLDEAEPRWRAPRLADLEPPQHALGRQRDLGRRAGPRWQHHLVAESRGRRARVRPPARVVAVG